jgi:hypothetical protein
LASFVLLLALGAGVAVWVWRLDAERRALAAMPAAERQPIYEREQANFAAMCRPPRHELSGECEEQARFLAEFPECDDGCRALVRELLR